jgi:hypothetical protein
MHLTNASVNKWMVSHTRHNPGSQPLGHVCMCMLALCTLGELHDSVTVCDGLENRFAPLKAHAVMSCKPTDIVKQLHLAAMGTAQGCGRMWASHTVAPTRPSRSRQRQPHLSPLYCVPSHLRAWLDPRFSRCDLVGASRVDPGTSGRESWGESMCWAPLPW